jgi:hypothetical protein
MQYSVSSANKIVSRLYNRLSGMETVENSVCAEWDGKAIVRSNGVNGGLSRLQPWWADWNEGKP